MNRIFLLSLLFVSSGLQAQVQDQKKPDPPKPAAEAPAKVEEDAYTKAVKDFKAEDGMFKVWRKDETVMFEIPADMIGREFLMSGELKQTPNGGYSGSEAFSRVISFQVRGDKILMRDMNYRVRADEKTPIGTGVAISNVKPIITTFDVKGKGPKGTVLIDVTRMMKSDTPEFSFRGAMGGGAMDPSRTFLERVLVYPDNINYEVLATFTGAGGPAVFGRGAGGGSSSTALLHTSMVLLPKTPMKGRIGDSRVGYFSTGVQDFSAPGSQGTKDYSFINRYRLEKKDPNAAMSEPVKPIVYYVAPEVPNEWRPFVKKAIEDWQPAFEAAGFKNAIIAKDAPNDPNWSPEDARYSVVRWAALPIANAMGPSTTDPRSGEILSAHVIIWHDVLKLAQEWYFAQASPNDPRARRMPYSTPLMGELVRFVVAHEVGHTLGLPHNGKSSAMIETELLRNPKWTAENGTCTSIMDYARFNYVAQPGDGANLIPIVGKYDKFSIKWGYSPISATTPWDEQRVLDGWAAAQVADKTLRFYDNFSSADPTAQSEALGDDAVKASNYGVMNLKRVMTYVPTAATKTGDDYSETARLWGAAMGQFQGYIGHVTAVVGGQETIDYHAGRGGDVINPVDANYQRRAVKWLCDNVLKTPMYLIPSSITGKLTGDAGLSRVAGMSSRAIGGLLQDQRIARMTFNELRVGKGAYTISEMLSDLNKEVWSELASANPVVDTYRRATQRAYVQALLTKLGGAPSDLRALARVNLETSLPYIRSKGEASKDLVTRAHLADLVKAIEFGLANPDKMAAPAVASPFGQGRINEADCPLHHTGLTK